MNFNNPYNTKEKKENGVFYTPEDISEFMSKKAKSFDENGICKITLTTEKFYVEEIIGRSIIIHENMDDLGRGGHKDSKTTGNSGKRIACAVIGFSEKSC